MPAATFVAGLMIAQQVAGKATRDAFFLTHFPASSLPSVMIAATVLSVIVILVISRVTRATSPASVAPWVFVINACLFFGEYALSQSAPRIAAVVVYLHIAALGAAAVSVFWSLVSECVDPHSAKRAIARIAIGASLGGLLGGLAGWQLGNHVPIQVLLVILGASNLVCAGGIRLIGRNVPTPSTETASPSALSIMRDTPYLRVLAMLVAFGAIAETIVDYVFKANAQAAYSSPSDLIAFFAMFYAGTGLLSFVLQSTIVERTLRSSGLVSTVATRPAFFLGGGILALVFPRFLSVVLLRGGAQVIENSFYRSGYEILYTPITPEKKRPTKTLIDVGLERLGIATGAGIVLLAAVIVPDDLQMVLLSIAVVVALVSLFLCSRLHGGYVDALAESLRAGSVELSENMVMDRTTMHTLSHTATVLDREKLLRDIEAMRVQRDVVEGPKLGPSMQDPTVEAIRDLRSGDANRVRKRLLHGARLESHYVSHVIDLLADKKYLAEVSAVLIEDGEQLAGQLVDSLRDVRLSDEIRRRIPVLLSKIGGQRCLDGLLAALQDPSADVRKRCSLALKNVVKRDPSQALPRRRVYECVIAEAQNDSLEHRIRLEQIAGLLSLVLDHDTVELAFRALKADDAALRSTGLEYLENVVPAGVYDALRPLFEAKDRGPRRPQKSVVKELLNSVDIKGIDIAAIKVQALKARNDT